MVKIFIMNISLLFFVYFPVYPDSIFNSIQWKRDYQVNNIVLYTNSDNDNKLNFYKAEIVLDNVLGDKFYNNLIDFDRYDKIFTKIFIFKKVEPGDGMNSGIYYSLLNFSPLKNRGYFVNLKYYMVNSSSEKKYVIEWQPVTEFKKFYQTDANSMNVKLIYGRWQIIETNGKLKISIEYYNDFEVVGPKEIIYQVEKSVTINALKELVRYTMAKK